MSISSLSLTARAVVSISMSVSGAKTSRWLLRPLCWIRGHVPGFIEKRHVGRMPGTVDVTANCQRCGKEVIIRTIDASYLPGHSR